MGLVDIERPKLASRWNCVACENLGDAWPLYGACCCGSIDTKSTEAPRCRSELECSSDWAFGVVEDFGCDVGCVVELCAYPKENDVGLGSSCVDCGYKFCGL